MLERPTAVFVLGALVALVASPAGAASAPKPAPTPPSLKTITHVRSTPLCSVMRRIIGPTIGKVLQNDKLIANSKPLLHDYVQATASGMGKGSQDLAVSRLERLIGPMVANSQQIDKLLNDPYAFPKTAYSDDDQKLLAMRQQLQAVNAQQKKALDIISGFVDTEQLGELQAEGNQYNAALNANPNNVAKAGATPPPPKADILNAGVDNAGNDRSRPYDPRYKNTDSAFANNPLNVFENAITSYQQDIQGSEQVAAKTVVDAVPQCGGRVPGQSVPAPSPSP